MERPAAIAREGSRRHIDRILSAVRRRLRYPRISARRRRAVSYRCGLHGMGMGGKIAYRERCAFNPVLFSDRIVRARAWRGARMHWNSASQVWQREGGYSVASVVCANQLKECVIVRNRQHGSIAKVPANGREV